jgi:magnesium transporter
MKHREGQAKQRTGLAPGILLYTGPKRTEKIEISVFVYNDKEVVEHKVTDVATIPKLFTENQFAWINVTGVHDTELVEDIGKALDLDNLELEDVVNTYQRPLAVEHEKYIFVTLKMIHGVSKDSPKVELEHISLFLKDNFVITFQEYKRDIFAPIRYRIRNTGWRIRNRKSDYLAYAIIDNITDHYFEVLETVGHNIDNLEEEIISKKNEQITSELYSLRRELVTIRRALVPLREVLSQITKMDHALIEKTTEPFLMDVYSHTLQLVETVDIYREMSSSLLETHLSSMSNRMNEVMKVLTIIATIFIPLTFIAGIYGMNFRYMPELNWHGGYFVVLGIMFIVALTMVLFFKRKKWI